MRMFVEKPVLIPRVETEGLCELALQAMKSKESFSFLDLGCGSGCISLYLLKNTQCSGLAIDYCDAAVELTKRNARKLLGPKWFKRLTVVKANVLEFQPKGKFDLVVSNPPYIPSESIKSLEKQVKNFESKKALDGGENGTSLIRFIMEKDWVAEGGCLCMEVDSSHTFLQGELFKDQFGRNRYLKLTK